MSDKSKIEWTDATWNPTRGCSRVSEGCRHCYAERVAARFDKPGLAYEGLTTNGRWNGKAMFVIDNLTEPLHWKRPRRIFVDSMSDLFFEGFTNVQIAAVFAVMAAAPDHTFQVLTKRPERAAEWFRWIGEDRYGEELHVNAPLFTLSHILHEAPINYPHALQLQRQWPLPNVWLGVSVEDQANADKRIPELLRIHAAVRFLSVEPLLGPVDLNVRLGVRADQRKIDWVIVGGESGPGARPCNVEWIRSIVAQCKGAGVPCFVKQLGAKPVPSVEDYGCSPHDVDRHWPDSVSMAGDRIFLADKKGGDWNEWNPDLRVREFPNV